METPSDSESEMLRTRFAALKVPTKNPADAPAPQHSPTATRIDRAALDADLRRRLQALGMSSTDSGTEVDTEELEKMLESEDEYLEELFPPTAHNELAEVRQIFAQLHGSRPGSRQSRPPRQDSTATISAVPRRLNQPYSADSDADDEGAADELISRFRDQLGLEDAHSRSTSSNSSRSPSVEPTRFPHHRDDAGDEEGTASDSSQSIKGTTRPTTAESKGASRDADGSDAEAEAAGQRTPPSYPTRLFADGGSDVNRYRVLFSSLETPRALPVLTPTSEDEPLPPAFAKLQSISPSMDRIKENPDDDTEAKGTPITPVPRLDLDGWRASKDDKPETWCGICNADAVVKCTGCDNDLYCKSCFAEGHPKGAFDAAEHKPVDLDPSS